MRRGRVWVGEGLDRGSGVGSVFGFALGRDAGAGGQGTRLVGEVPGKRFGFP